MDLPVPAGRIVRIPWFPRQERAWLRGAQAGRVADIEALFRHHWPLAYRTAYLVALDAAASEDIAQEAFLSAIQHLDRFDRRRPFAPWLHRIVVNRAIDWTRARTLRAEVGAELVHEPEAPEPSAAIEAPTAAAMPAVVGCPGSFLAVLFGAAGYLPLEARPVEYDPNRLSAGGRFKTASRRLPDGVVVAAWVVRRRRERPRAERGHAGGHRALDAPVEQHCPSTALGASGFRVAYLAGSDLHVVVGNGTDDRRCGATLPSWRPRGNRVPTSTSSRTPSRTAR